eukprot:XP_002258532.1 hypothetical protein, conserved in Plasmodium species [Plasmodium knowlesi strain H]
MHVCIRGCRRTYTSLCVCNYRGALFFHPLSIIFIPNGTIVKDPFLVGCLHSTYACEYFFASYFTDLSYLTPSLYKLTFVCKMIGTIFSILLTILKLCFATSPIIGIILIFVLNKNNVPDDKNKKPDFYFEVD